MGDGHGLAATAQRRKVWREGSAGAFPGTARVGSEPDAGLGTEVVPWDEGHAPERAVCSQVLQRVQRRAVWRAARHCCPRAFLCPRDRGAAFFIIRPHAGLPYDLGRPLRACGRIETGPGAAQRVRVGEAQGEAHGFRRLRLKLVAATRDGDRQLSIVTTLPRRQGSTKGGARLSRHRGPLETAVQ
jgi:hypothetical protein